MIIKKLFSALFAAVGIFAAVFTVKLSFDNANAMPVLLTPPEEAEARVVEVMDTVCAGDYDGVSALLYGNPVLGVDREAADAVSVLLWDAFTDSLSYELVGECYATDNGLAQNVRLTSLNLDSVTGTLRDRSHALLAERVEAATDTSEIYDENNDYREEFVMDALYDAAAAALAEDAETVTVEFTLNLTYQSGQWWVMANNELLDAISGGVLY